MQIFGIGHIEVSKQYPTLNNVRESVLPTFLRKAYIKPLKNSLCDKHKTFAEAGNSQGGRYTPFKSTTEDVIAKVNRCPGICLKDLIESIDHHYENDSNARSSISHYIREGIIKGIEARKDGRYIRYYPMEIKI